jgi:transcriptional regulator with PAS, ATPase and Fis domain
VGAFAYTIFIDIWDKKLCDKVMNKLIEKHETDPVPYSTQYDFSSLIGANPDFLNLKELAKNIASHENVTVLITGESGTGKELFAQAIHKWSKRSLFPFVRVNCAGIPNSLLESELFGYEDGAFTGARRGGKAGKLELAHNGTVFLDEIGELPLAMQSKLLVFLQERVVERLGSNKPLKVNVRILAATNRNLEHMVGENLFREDLYYRLNVGRIDIPPLRHRKEDIELLARHVLSLHSRRLGINVTDISPQVWQLLSHHQWPGNIRELENSLERAMILADAENSQCLLPHHFPALNNNINPGRNTGMANTDIKDLKTMLNEYERMVITHILTEAKQNKVQAAKYLGINLSSLYRKVRKHGIDDTL